MDELHKRILDGAEDLFMSLGLRSVSMDDVASRLSISKKTIYKYFKDKADLIGQVAKKCLNEDEVEFKRIEEESKDPIDQMHQIADYARESITRMHPSVMFDVKKYYLDTWDIIQAYHKESILGRMIENLRQGIQTDLYRSDINPEILGKLLYHEFEFTFDPQFFDITKSNPLEVYNELFRHFLMGVLTEKGKKLYDEYEK